jgi:hypothetical protein
MPRVSTHFGLRDARLQSVVMPQIIPVAISTAGNVTYTPAQLLSGWINRDGNGGARTDTLPSAAAMCESVQGCMVGTAFEFELRNTSGTAIAITLAAGAGGTLNAASTSVAQSNSRTYLFNFTNVTIGQEAYTVWSKGAGAF